MFFKGEVGDKIFLAGGYRPILQTIYFKKDAKLGLGMFSSAIFNKLEGGKNRSVQKIFLTII